MSCKKAKPTVQIKVIDQITNYPVSSARVIVYKCGTFNCNLGTIDLFSDVTDNNGICTVPEDSYNEALYARVERADYWSWDETKTTLKKIVPAGWMRLRIIKTSNYPDQSRLQITIISQSTNSSGSAFAVINNFNAAADSSILIKGFGGQPNKIEWQVYGPNTVVNSGSWDQQVPPLDTVKNITLNY